MLFNYSFRNNGLPSEFKIEKSAMQLKPLEKLLDIVTKNDLMI